MRSKEKISNWVIVPLGFLSLAPILGGIVGVILIFSSVIYFKNRTLLLMGIVGVSITAISMAYLRYSSTHRGSFDGARISGARFFMGKIIRELEFYEKSYGHYPDNLTFLKVTDPTIQLHDPIQQVNPKEDQGFYYKPAGHKYYLFSRGFDSIPFTDDDIYPDVINTSNIGLIVHDSSSKNGSTHQKS